MSASELPSDPSQWPRDPYQLLGIARDADRRTVRGAYTQLLRRFKPEQSPQEFRLIRDAYETVLRQLDWAERFFTDNSGHEPSSASGNEDAAPVAWEADIGESSPHSGREGSSQRDLGRQLDPERDWRGQLDQFWTQAKTGDYRCAYEQLVELERQFPGRDDVCLRLYWLRVLYADVDDSRAPIDWLVRGLKGNPSVGTLSELYRRELELHPREALGARSHELIHAWTDPQALADLAEWRWREAAKARDWEILASDLNRLSPLCRNDAADVWGRLLVSAVEHLSWVSPRDRPPLYPWCFAELEQLEHIHHDQGYLFSRLDMLDHVSRGWHVMKQNGTIPGDLVDLVYLSWNGPEETALRRAVHFAESFVAHRNRLLEIFDSVRQCGLGPLGQLNSLYLRAAEKFSIDDAPTVDPVKFTPLVSKLALWMPSYAKIRKQILRVCLQNAVGPEIVQEVALHHSVTLDDGTELAVGLAADHSLKSTYLALRLFAA